MVGHDPDDTSGSGNLSKLDERSLSVSKLSEEKRNEKPE